MLSREIDTFRNAFFQKLIEDEAAKAAALKLKQQNCFHRYEHLNDFERICSKCEHSTCQKIKSYKEYKEFKESKNTCVIS